MNINGVFLYVYIWLLGILPGFFFYVGYTDYTSISFLDEWNRVQRAIMGLIFTLLLFVPGFFMRNLPLKIWSNTSAVICILFALVIFFDQRNHNSYSGYGAFIIVPVMGALMLNCLLYSIYATYSISKVIK